MFTKSRDIYITLSVNHENGKGKPGCLIKKCFFKFPFLKERKSQFGQQNCLSFPQW